MEREVINSTYIYSIFKCEKRSRGPEDTRHRLTRSCAKSYDVVVSSLQQQQQQQSFHLPLRYRVGIGRSFSAASKRLTRAEDELARDRTLFLVPFLLLMICIRKCARNQSSFYTPMLGKSRGLWNLRFKKTSSLSLSLQAWKKKLHARKFRSRKFAHAA